MPRKNNVSLCSHRGRWTMRRLRALSIVSSCVCVLFAPRSIWARCSSCILNKRTPLTTQAPVLRYREEGK
ncbi:hypothetical protein LY76DRAFT_8075 [Colletotrichum caudatum]|nr:hypothetical protein LY76DRAFT_8075 [Colletotrichum caudatum]